MIKTVNDIAQNYGALINGLLTCVLVVSTIIYVWITRGMLKEMILSRRLSIAPRLEYSIDTGMFSVESPKMNVVIKNVGRGDAFTVTFSGTISYVKDGSVTRQESKVSNPSPILKSGERFEAGISFLLGEGSRPLVSSRDTVGFEAELRCADGDGHETVTGQLYATTCINPDSERPFYALKRIYKIPTIFRFVHRFTAPNYGKYWEVSPKEDSRTIKGVNSRSRTK